MLLEISIGVAALLGATVAIFGVRGTAFGALNLYRRFNVFLLGLRGMTPENAAERRIVTGQAWAELCDSLKAAGASLVVNGCPMDPQTQTEGYRYLARLARAGFENFVECSDPHAPQLNSIIDGLRVAPIKMGSDNPDNKYENAVIDSTFTYRLRCTRGTIKYLGFGTQAGQYGKPGGLKTVDYKEASELDIRQDGTFEIIIGPEPPTETRKGLNYIRTQPDPREGLLIVRQTFGDRDKEVPAEIVIERVDEPGRPQPLSASKLEDAFQSTALLVAGASMMFTRWAIGFKKHANQLPLFDQETSNKVGGDPNIRYYHSYWNLADDEALVITATPPECMTWNFQLNNFWMESLDYKHFPTHVNKFTANYKHDGSVVIVVSKAPKPEMQGSFNWIDTQGRSEGTMCFRWVKPSVADSDLPHPSTKVVKLAEIE